MEKVACYAAGVIGSSFAVNFAMKGLYCAVYVTNDDRKSRGTAAIERVIASLKESGVLTGDGIGALRKNILVTTEPAEAFEGVSLIQENGPENLDVKRGIMEVVERFAPADAVFASSTSSLSISEIADLAQHPARCIGAHPFNPPHLIPLVEITKSGRTAAETVERAVRIYRAAGKEPVVLNMEKPGFIANRFQHVVLRETISLVCEGVCSLEDADRALVYGPGLRWAAVGQGMIGELASPLGARAFNERFAPASERIFRDLSNMTEIPAEWPVLAGEGVEREKAEMPDFIGHSPGEIGAFRDRVLIELLRFHHKI